MATMTAAKPDKIKHLTSFKLMPVSRLVVDPKNLRKHTKQNLDAIKRSYLEFGQMRPIVLAKDGKTVLAGNGQLEVARQLGVRRLLTVRADHLSLEQARAFSVADNRSAELAEWDYSELALTLKAFPDQLKLAAGFDKKSIDALLAKVAKTGNDLKGLAVGGLSYRVIVTVKSEQAQAALIARLEKEGFECLPLMS